MADVPQEEGRTEEPLEPEREKEVRPQFINAVALDSFVHATTSQAHMQISNFEGRRIRHFAESWKKITSDREI